ncbi:MAG: hypothetical protein RL215_2634 [Planctomycetota bacterium]
MVRSEQWWWRRPADLCSQGGRCGSVFRWRVFTRRRSIGGRSGLRLELSNGVVIHVSAEIDGQRLGDIVIAAGQIPRSDSGSKIRHVVQSEEESC